MKINKSKNSLKSKKGITLIALVITIIVLLILAGVSISLVVGNNGVLTQASNAVIENRKAEAREDVAMAFASAEADYWSDWAKGTSIEKNVGYYNGKMSRYLPGATVTAGSTDGTYTVDYNGYTFSVDSDGNVTYSGEGTAVNTGETGTGGSSSATTYSVSFYEDSTLGTLITTVENVSSGEFGSSNMPTNPTRDNYTFVRWKKESDDSEFTASTPISANTSVYADWTLNGTAALANSSYVGYYIKKGNEYAIIYIDLLGKKTYTGGALQSSTSSVSVPSSVTSGKTFKTYVVTDTKYTDPNFGTNNVIEVSNSTGEDRFIAMALSDYDTNDHVWWNWFYSNSSSLGTSYEIGSGKTNTETVKTAWDNAGTSAQNTNSSYTDIWSLITLNSGSADWFIPSNNEWIAFGAMSWTDSASTPVARTITSSNYSTGHYWSSSQRTSCTNDAQLTHFSSGYMNGGSMRSNTLRVRLSTTF